MKLCTLFIVTSILFSSSSYSQVKFGVRAGYAKNSFGYSLNGLSYVEASKNGFYAGVTLEKSTTDFLSAIVGVEFITRGSEYSSGSISVKRHFNYVDIPIGVELKLPISSRYVASVNGGIFSAILLSGEMQVTMNNHKIITQVDKELNKLFWGLNFGAGLKIYSPTGRYIMPEINYRFSLSSVSKDPKEKAFTDDYLIGLRIVY